MRSLDSFSDDELTLAITQHETTLAKIDVEHEERPDAIRIKRRIFELQCEQKCRKVGDQITRHFKEI